MNSHQQAMERLKKRADDYRMKCGWRKEKQEKMRINLDEIKNASLRTMAKELSAEYPEILEVLPPTPRAYGIYSRLKSIQKKGMCCGYKMTPEQMHELFALANRKTIRDKVKYMCRIIDKLNTERTLETIKRRLRRDNILQNVAARLQVSSSWTIKYWADLVLGKYSPNDIMIACEIAEGKENPPAYFTAIFRNGKPKWLVENETH